MKEYETGVTASNGAGQKRPPQANNHHKNVSLSIQSRPIKASLINDIGSIIGSTDRHNSGNIFSQNQDK